MTVRFWLPWPPSISQHTGVVRGRKILSKKARQWFSDAAASIQEQRPKRLSGPVQMSLTFYAPSRRLYDPDNKLKCLLDAIVKAGIIEDDNCSIIPDNEQHHVSPDDTRHKDSPPGVVVEIWQKKQSNF